MIIHGREDYKHFCAVYKEFCAVFAEAEMFSKRGSGEFRFNVINLSTNIRGRTRTEGSPSASGAVTGGD